MKITSMENGRRTTGTNRVARRNVPSQSAARTNHPTARNASATGGVAIVLIQAPCEVCRIDPGPSVTEAHTDPTRSNGVSGNNGPCRPCDCSLGDMVSCSGSFGTAFLMFVIVGGLAAATALVFASRGWVGIFIEKNGRAREVKHASISHLPEPQAV